MINAGIVGIGWWGRTLVDSVQGKSGKIRFTAGCTGRKDRARDYCDGAAIALVDGLDDLLGDAAIDAIVLASPHSMHARQMAAAARAGKHVFCEKPFTLEHAGAEAAFAACADAGVVCAAGFNRRFNPAMIALRDMVRDGELGTVLHAEGHFSSGGALAYTPAHWRASRAESPAGGMAGLGIHVVDAFISMLGPIARVTAISQRRAVNVDMDDTTAMVLEFTGGPTGCLATLAATAQYWRLHVFGSEGWAEMRGYESLVFKRRDGAEEAIDFPALDLERTELEAFADAVEGHAPYPVPASEVIHGVAVFEAIARSGQSGQTVTL